MQGINPNELNQMLNNHHQNSLRISENEIVICHKCQSEFFISGARFAKKKVDLKNYAVGLIHETPHIVCLSCKTVLPREVGAIQTKGDLVLDATPSEGTPMSDSIGNTDIIGG